ncbi:glutathione S-transferase Gst1 [Marasmius crinis-equi]|uniref:Glutathione S-transferase Gst1 n=1 Tax=Marasmius crinis-equi TaxID=585013 RepID=A0ABR3FGN3_9AGAR
MPGTLRVSLPRFASNLARSSTPKITLYDVGPTHFGEMGMSPFARGIRFALNYKSLPYAIHEVTLPTIEPTAKALGASPTPSFLARNQPRYTVPFIHDPSTGRVLSDSLRIASYLDETYPDRPLIVPPEKETRIGQFCDSVSSITAPLIPIIMPFTISQWMSSEMQKTFPAGAGVCKLTPEEQDEVWESVVAGFRGLMNEYDIKAIGDNQSAPWVMRGRDPSWADMLLTGFFWWIRAVFFDSKGWKEIEQLGGGRVGSIIEDTLEVCGPRLEQ